MITNFIARMARPRKYALSVGFIALTLLLYCVIHPQVVHRNHTSRSNVPLILPKADPVRSPELHISKVVQHGRIVEIVGDTDPGAVVMINGQSAATIFDHNSFRHFVGPLPSGTTIITVTSQDERGGVNTQRVAVTIE